ncbi:hypothetical protein M427DRAFT_66794 [Gonapodya prolifera JEL478]|uniref:CCDC113/CCDC96 coiled-coil domain-containing protein n=1 Tax=Gonapodya prolifera (strain JEL478) TaxID=1344416 RepID=A0A139AUA1_GONPJ|nr:hypothetical protein M427DRAFT_66794 [Gonapodya prolifera JEL478]|eukprot:KXS20284.1 hypothetical protein M427DRAFT_66794 [Gonapodya prolifera JEL478]
MSDAPSADPPSSAGARPPTDSPAATAQSGSSAKLANKSSSRASLAQQKSKPSSPKPRTPTSARSRPHSASASASKPSSASTSQQPPLPPLPATDPQPPGDPIQNEAAAAQVQVQAPDAAAPSSAGADTQQPAEGTGAPTSDPASTGAVETSETITAPGEPTAAPNDGPAGEGAPPASGSGGDAGGTTEQHLADGTGTTPNANPASQPVATEANEQPSVAGTEQAQAQPSPPAQPTTDTSVPADTPHTVDTVPNPDQPLPLPPTSDSPASPSDQTDPSNTAPVADPTPLSEPGLAVVSVVPQQEQEQTQELAPDPEPEQDRPPPIDRDDVVRKIRGSLDMRDRMKAQGMLLQNKLSEYFRKKRADDAPDSAKSSADHDQRYSTSLAQLQSLQAQLRELEHTTTSSITAQTDQLRARQEQVSLVQQEYAKFKRGTALGAESARTGEQLGKKALESLETAEARKEAEVAAVRLENIKLRNRLRRQEALLRQKEELADGLHLIDFEQLKIENQTYNEKIEERNEELLKLRKKITNVVQVLTHVKEKLHFVQNETVHLRETLSTLDAEVNQERDALPLAKHEANQLRKMNAQLKQRNGLLGNVPLLRDFERKVDESEELQRQADELRAENSAINHQISRVKRRIAKAQLLGFPAGVKM